MNYFCWIGKLEENVPESMISSHFPEIFLQYFLWNIHELMIYSLYWLIKQKCLCSGGELRSILLTNFLSSEAGRPARLTLQLGRTFIRRATSTEPVSLVSWRKQYIYIYMYLKEPYISKTTVWDSFLAKRCHCNYHFLFGEVTWFNILPSSQK